MLNTIRKYINLLIFIAICSTAYGQDSKGEEEIFTMGLEELMQIEVVSASRSVEGISDAPGIITSITSEEIKRFGGMSLLDVLERSAGIYITGTYFLPENYISIRGDAASHYNRHVLILINGRPVRETLFGGVDFSVLKSIPLAAIRQIEIIRGPGSVLYGSNAYTGVVNILLDKNKEELNLMVSGGSLDTRQVEITNTTSKGDLLINSGVKYARTDGYENEIVSELNESLVRKMGYNTMGAFTRIDYQSLEVTGMVNHTAQNNFGTLPIADFPGSTPFLNRDVASTRLMLDVGYNFEINNDWDLKLNSTFNESLISYDATDGDFEGQSSDILFELTNFIRVAENINLLAGGTVYAMSAGGELSDNPNQGITYTDQTWYSAYVQADFKPIEKLKLIAGGQVNIPEGIDANFVPRLGAIFKATDELGIKALYGQAFRTGYIAEQQAFEPPILQGNPDLQPQTVETIDLQLFYNGAKIQGSITGYNSVMKDVIALTAPPNQTYVNQGELEFMGVEIEGKYLVNDNFFINGSYTYQQNETDGGQENVTHVPQSLGKIGLNYRKDWLVFGVSNMTVAEISSVSEVNPAVRQVNPDPENYNFMSVNLDIDLMRLANAEKDYELHLKTYVQNLLDEEIYYPEFTRRNINSIQGRAGRIIQVGMQMTF